MVYANDDKHPESKDKESNTNRCSHCGLEKKESELHSRLVRDGISTKYLALPFIYRRKNFCESCFTWHGKKDRFERVLAIIGLIILATIILAMLLPAFL